MNKIFKNITFAVSLSSAFIVTILLATKKESQKPQESIANIWQKPSQEAPKDLKVATCNLINALLSRPLESQEPIITAFFRALAKQLEQEAKAQKESDLIYKKLCATEFYTDLKSFLAEKPSESSLKTKLPVQWSRFVNKIKVVFEKIQPCFKDKLHQGSPCEHCNDLSAVLSLHIQTLLNAYGLHGLFDTASVADLLVDSILWNLENVYPHKVDSIIYHAQKMLGKAGPDNTIPDKHEKNK